VVDEVSDVVDLEADSIKDAPDFGTSIDASFIHGLSEVNEDMVILLNIDTMLESCELVQLDKITTTEEES
jgi:purine-binding chemotaxis protein CheW